MTEFALQKAWKIIIELVRDRSEFREQREKLERLWEKLLSLLDEQTTTSEFEELQCEMEKFIQLFSKCDKVSSCNVVMKSYYSEKLKKKGNKIEVLLQQNVMLVRSRSDESLRPPLPGKVFGIEMPLIELKGRLRKHQVVGICGIGGCRKTTFVSALCHDSDIKAEYGNLTSVSNSPGLLATICQRLVREFNEMDSTPGARKMLIVLDDVSSVDNDIRVLVDAMKEKAADSRILITSRAQLHICDASYHLNLLSEDDTRKLFEHHALYGGRERCWKPDRQLIDELCLHQHAVVKCLQIVRGCKLHPLAWTVIGGSLAKGDERMWRGTANSLKQNGGIFSVGNGDAIIECLSTSLTSLSKECRECFLDLGYFPQSQTIPASAIIDMWTETRDLDENGAYVFLRELDRRNLVQLVDRKCGGAGDPDGSFSSLSISQHDLLRELAISESKMEGKSEIIRLFIENREVNIPKTWTLEKGPTTQAKLVSINTGDMKNSDWPDLDLPNAEVLILNFSASSFYLPTFLRSMKNLKVLVVANHGYNRAELDGLSLLYSLKKLKRVMFRKIMLPAGTQQTVEGGSMSITLGASGEPPQELQKLSLVLCDVRHMAHIPSLFPIVRDLEVDYCTNLDEMPDTICDISNLEKLSITNNPDLLKLAEGIDKLSELKVLRLHACGKLKHLPQSLSKLSKLRFLDILGCHELEAFPQELEKLSSLEKIDMRCCPSMMELPPSMVQMECLKKVICDEEVAALWTSCGLDPSKLEKRRQEVDLDFSMMDSL